MNFEVIKKQKGLKVLVRILCDGVEIGCRTSARPYRRALVVKLSQAFVLANIREGFPYHKRLAEEYERKSQELDHPISSQQYSEWAKIARENLARLIADEARLSSGPQPEFDAPMVASFHTGKVPAVQPWHVFVAVVEIPEWELGDTLAEHLE